MSVEKEIFVEDVLELLDNGKTREEIQVHYDLTKKELVHLFQHPDLKGRKTKSVPKIIIRKRGEVVESTPQQTENVVETQVVEETVVEQVQEVVEHVEETVNESPFPAPTPGNAFTAAIPADQQVEEVPAETVNRPVKTRANGANVFGGFGQPAQETPAPASEEAPATPVRPRASWTS